MNWIIYTDLDGTLLDFTTYSYREAEKSVKLLADRDIPLVFCSSKTRLEQEVYREALHLQTPFIVENGSAILIPRGYFSFEPDEVETLKHYSLSVQDGYQRILLGEPSDYIRKAIAEARRSAGIQPMGYADLSLEEIMQRTGLDREAAQRAAHRDYSETLLQSNPDGSGWQHFLKLLDAWGLQCVSGGKFYTVMGKGSDKGKAIEVLNKLFTLKYGTVRSVGLGDSANDLPMLQVVDEPFLVQKPSGAWQEIDDERIAKVDAVGPAGFNQVIHKLLSR